MTPKAMKPILTTLGTIDKYDLIRPNQQPPIVAVETYDAVQRVMQNEGREFASAYGAKAHALVPGNGRVWLDSDVRDPNSCIVTAASSLHSTANRMRKTNSS